MLTASWIALSAHAMDWAPCICSIISWRRRWSSGSLKKPKPSMASSYPARQQRHGAAAAGVAGGGLRGDGERGGREGERGGHHVREPHGRVALERVVEPRRSRRQPAHE